MEAYSSCGRMYSLYMLDRACLFSPLSLSRLRSPRRRRVFEITVLSCVPHCRLLVKLRPRCFCVVVIGRLVFPRESCSKAVFSVQTERVKRRDDDFVGLTKRDYKTVTFSVFCLSLVFLLMRKTRKYLRKEMSKRGLKFIVFVQCLLFLSPTNLSNVVSRKIFHGLQKGKLAIWWPIFT